MNGISRLAPDRFRVDFARLAQAGLLGRLRGMLSAAPVSVDPYKIGQAVGAVMAQSTERDVHGRLLVWNAFKVYLSRSDHDRLRPLQGRLRAGLDALIRQQLDALDAETVGDPVVRVMVDEEIDLPVGVGEVVVAYVENRAIAAPVDGEVTVRVRRAPRPAPLPASTQRVPEPEQVGALVLRWSGGSHRVAPGQRVLIGRPHPEPPEGFIPLTGASNRINSIQLTIDNAADGVVLSRPARANPVAIQGHPLQPGGRLVLQEDAVQIDLSSGELALTLRRT